jgi:GAF domain-containing protein/HAMP domain-containing protein
VDIKLLSAEERQKRNFLNSLLLYGALIAGLTSITNLVLFLIQKNSQMLPIAAGTILCSGISILARPLLRRNHLLLSAFIASLAWAGYFVIHDLFWAGFLTELLIGIWILPILLITNLPSGLRRLTVFIPSLIASFALFSLDNSTFFTRIQSTEITFIRFIAPTYIAIFGTLFFLVILRGFQTRRLFARMMAAMIILVSVPIAVLSIVSYYNTKLGDNRAATTTLNQITVEKSNELQTWSARQTDALFSPLGRNDSFYNIVQLLTIYASGTSKPEPYFTEVTDTLNTILIQSDFEEIYLMSSKGLVVASTRGDLIGTDYRYMEFFWRGKLTSSIIHPRYYPPENEVSVFISRPIRNYSGEVIGVLSGRTNIDRLLAIINQPISDKFQSGEQYLINVDNALLTSSTGLPNQYPQTEGTKMLLSTLADGSGSYNNADNIPVVGAYRWVSDLGVGVIIEATQAEVYQRLPGIIATNIGIGVIAFFLAAVAAAITVRSITQPIDILVRTSQEVISGNLEARAEIERNDEIGTLTKAFNEMTGELKSLVSDLEARVAERTRDLEHRSLELQTAAQIARDASLASNVDDLLNRTVRLIRDRFGFYHVGIFLHDDRGEYTVLHAAGGDAGQVMLANKYKLPIGEVGIVGYVSKSGEPRIALDVGEDAVHFRNPLLPYTRSEMALPLKVGSRILGVLDVQSDKVNVFDQNDITIMEILTDQLAIAIERTRLLQESNENTLALEHAFREQTSRAWQEYLEDSSRPRGYRYEGSQIQPINILDSEELNLASNKPIILPNRPGIPGCTAIIPIRLRGQTLGRLSLRFSITQIPSETIRLLEEAANRLSLALENARLVQNAQRLASQEQQINIISGQIQQSTDLETILQNTIRELGKTLGVPKAFIQVGLVPPNKSN